MDSGHQKSSAHAGGSRQTTRVGAWEGCRLLGRRVRPSGGSRSSSGLSTPCSLIEPPRQRIVRAQPLWPAVAGRARRQPVVRAWASSNRLRGRFPPGFPDCGFVLLEGPPHAAEVAARCRKPRPTQPPPGSTAFLGEPRGPGIPPGRNRFCALTAERPGAAAATAATLLIARKTASMLAAGRPSGEWGGSRRGSRTRSLKTPRARTRPGARIAGMTVRPR